jgi:A/G-specific adenine glycosylase
VSTRLIQKKIITWFRQNQRPLPWRKSNNWYQIWVSEVMLQQTQVEQVIPYYNRFIKKFPTVGQLAAAAQQTVLKVWEGLGYYSRARNLHQSAKLIMKSFDGQLPRDRDRVSQLPGFGPYTTNAVLSLAFNQPYAVVDGNIKRVISRLFAIDEDMRKPSAHKKIQSMMDELLPGRQSRLFNEAMMELGALICLPQKPRCQDCPLSQECKAWQQGIQEHLPFLSKKAKIPKVSAITFIISNADDLLLVKRPDGGMLAGLWEFPTLKIPAKRKKTESAQKLIRDHFGLQASDIKRLAPVKHAYTHFQLNLQPVLITTSERNIKTTAYAASRWLTLKALKKLPLHGAVWKVLNRFETESIVIADRNIPDA